MDVRSAAFQNTNQLPQDYTCDGPQVSPPLEWYGAPAETKSFVIFCVDADSPGRPYYHWGLYNIPSSKSNVPANFSVREYHQATEQAKNSGGSLGYGAACPPPGDDPHRYHFHVWALDVERLEFDSTPTVEEMIERARKHVIDRGEIQAWYER